ncbi:MAG: Crotonobetainyl-CoA:carnitine CoA-transferase CaiB, partial [Acidimicrobiales bacterium]|nr:Crotonobetainyl-CoA:carnitine CoA-transferase CaiB [Acidimicrobiales bacterium]
YVVPQQHGEDSLFFETFNRNKRSLSLGIATPEGRAVFEDLVKVSDVVHSNLRGDVPAKLRIRYDDLKHLNPAIVCCSLSGFGMTGPRSAEPGYDYILQGMAGWMDLTGEPDGPPTKSGLSLVDYSGGLVAAMSMLTALHAARRDGVGGDCDVSLFDTAIAMLTYPGTWHLSAGYQPGRAARSAHPSVVPFQNLPTADGWIVVACPKEKFWHRLAGAAGRPELATDARYATMDARLANRGELVAVLDELFRSRTTDEWIDALTAAGVPCGPVNDVAQAFADPQTAARDLVIETEHPVLGVVRQPAGPVRVGEEKVEHRRAPLPDEHADEVLRGLLGYDDDRVAELRRGGAFGPRG